MNLRPISIDAVSAVPQSSLAQLQLQTNSNSSSLHMGSMRPPCPIRFSLLLVFRTANPSRLAFQPILRRSICSTPVSRSICPSDFREHTVSVPVGSSGDISLNVLDRINHPGSPHARPNVILYLPPGPLSLPSSAHSTNKSSIAEPSVSPQHVLASTSLSTVVTVNYRLGQAPLNGGNPIWHHYPIPVHDTLAGFDWILQNLSPEKLCVYGTHVGGSLAVMLALTELNSVRAIAAREPVCDWVVLDDYCIPASEVMSEDDMENVVGWQDSEELATGLPSPIEEAHRKRGRKKKKSATVLPDLLPLLTARKTFFRKPENYFDSFASPILFLRTPGKNCPSTFPTYITGPDYPIPVLKSTSKETVNADYATSVAAELDLDFEPEEAEPSNLLTPVKRRRTISRWPPSGFDYTTDSFGRTVPNAGSVTLPHVRIFVHSNNIDDKAKSSFNNDAGNNNTIDDVNTKLDNLSLREQTGGYANNSQETTSAQADPDSDSKSETSFDQATAAKPSFKGVLHDAQKASSHEETVLARQGAEMVYLMRSACFWGREKGFGERRVQLIRVPNTNREDDAGVPEKAGKWFREVFGALRER